MILKNKKLLITSGGIIHIVFIKLEIQYSEVRGE